MNKLVRKFVSLVLTVESFSLIGLSVKGQFDYNSIDTYVKINQREKKSRNPIPLYRNENNELVDIFGTVLRYKGKVLNVPGSFFNEFPRWDASKSPVKACRSDEEILENLSKSPDHGLGRNEKNELILVRNGQKVHRMNQDQAMIVPEKYLANFPVISVDMSEELYEYLVNLNAIKSHKVYRNKYNRLIDEFGNGLKYGGKFIHVPVKYRSEIQEHLLDTSNENMIKFNESLDYENHSLYDSCISREILSFERKHSKSHEISDNQENKQSYVKSYDEHYDKQLTTIKDNHTQEGSGSFVGKAISLPLIWFFNEYIF